MSETRETAPSWRPGPENPVWATRSEAAAMAGVTVRQFDNWRKGRSGTLPEGIEDNRLRAPRFHKARLRKFLESLSEPEDLSETCHACGHPVEVDTVECPACGEDLTVPD